MPPLTDAQQDVWNEVRNQFHRWQRAHLLTDVELESVLTHLQTQQDSESDFVSLKNWLDGILSSSTGLPEAAKQIELNRALIPEIRLYEQAGRLLPSSAKKIIQEIERQLATAQGDPAGSASGTSANETAGNAGSQASLLERLLDPKSLQTLMLCGGGLLVIGLVAWLWSIGMFENRLIMAACLGAGNLSLLGIGIVLIQMTPYQLAGRGVTMLGSLLLPLNLWFYDSQGLITLSQGGQLWIPALVCTVIYAGVARILKDPMFVYTLVGGVALTGLLLLADQRVARFWELIAPSTLLVVLGVICIHLERLFTFRKEGPKSREFGHAFFQAGHVSLASGLAILLGGMFIKWFGVPGHNGVSMFPAFFVYLAKLPFPGEVLRHALLPLFAGVYAYFYSQAVSKFRQTFLALAMLTQFGTGMVLLNLLEIYVTYPVLCMLIAFLALQVYVAVWILNNRNSSFSQALVSSRHQQPNGLLYLARLLLVFVLGVQTASFLLVNFMLPIFGKIYAPFFSYALLAVTCGVAAWVESRLQRTWFTLFALAVAMLSAQLAFFVGASLLDFRFQLAILCQAGLLIVVMLVGYQFLSAPIHRDRFSFMLKTGGGFLLLLGGLFVCFVYQHSHKSVDWNKVFEWTAWGNSLLGLLLAILFGGIAIQSPKSKVFPVTVFCLWLSIWQFLVYSNWITNSAILSASLLGLVLMLLSRVASGLTLDWKNRLTFSGVLAVDLAATAGLLLSLNRLGGWDLNWSLPLLVLSQLFISLVTYFLCRTDDQRSGIGFMAVMQFLMITLLVNQLSELTLSQQMRILSILAGLLLLLAGHLGWWKEQESRTSLVSFQLLCGSLLLVGTFTWGLMQQRFGDIENPWGWVMLYELGTLITALALLGLGIICQIRSTTLTGATLLVIYVLSLLTLLHLPEQLQNVAVYMMAGGAAFFSVAVLLSIYRDRLLLIPEKIRQGDGVFKVLKWR